MSKKILVISNLYPPDYLGGYELLCQEVVNYLRTRDFDIKILTSDFGSSESNENVLRELKLTGSYGSPPLRRLSFDFLKYLKIYNDNYCKISNTIKEYKPDLVFLWSQARLSTASFNSCRDLNAKTVMTLNDDHILSFIPSALSFSPKKLLRWFLDKTFFQKTTLKDNQLPFPSCIISDFLRKKIERNGINLPKSEKIYQGIELDKFPYCKKSYDISDPLKILYCGQLSHHKQVHVLIKAVDLVEESVELRIVGDGEEFYKKQLTDLSVKSKQKIIFAGKVPRENLVSEYQNSDMFIFTSLQEPFGLTFIEAMAVGVPVISTLDGGHCECLADKMNCLIFEVGNEQDLAYKINEMANNKELRIKLAENAHEMVEERLDINNYFKEIENFINSNLDQSCL